MFTPERVLAVAVLAAFAASCACAEAGRAGIVKAGLPGEDPALVSALAQEIIAAGYSVMPLDAKELCDPAIMNAQTFDLLVLPNASELPVKSIQPISEFAKAGGDIIALNAPLWQRPLINVDGRWTTRDGYQRDNAAKLPPHVLFEFSDDLIKTWHRSSNNMASPTTCETVSDGPGPNQRALHVVINDLTSYDTFGVSGLDNPFPKGHTLTVFSAKGDGNTSQLAIEWDEKDGSRWIAVIPLYPEWRQYVLTPKDFRFWISVPGRGGRGDSFNPENAVGFSVGLAFTHTENSGGKHEFWVGPVGTAPVVGPAHDVPADLGPALGTFDLPALETLCPSYKFFDVHGPVTLSLRQDQAIVSTQEALPKLAADAILRSPQPRPGGGGFDKRRDWRFIPLVEARAEDGQWRGAPVAMIVNADGPYKGAVWASFGFAGSDIYKSPAMLAMVRQIAARMRNGVFILDGGADHYTYFEDQTARIGTRIANVSSEERYVHATVDIYDDPATKAATYSHGWEVAKLMPGEIRTVSSELTRRWRRDGTAVHAYIKEASNKDVIDRVTHTAYTWEPKADKHFVTIKDGEFMLDGKRWRAHGVNYMPSSGIGTEDGEYFEHWLGARSYDPEIIDRDLDHIKNMGLNAVSIFIYTGYEKDQNLLDILRRLDERNMKANVGLRPGLPLWFDWSKIRNIIESLRLAQNDTVFAYDIAWEPMFGTHEERKRYDQQWEQWIVERYGSVENAEKDWSFRVPRNEDGSVTNPLPHQIDTDGEWRVMTAAYRRFLDTLLYRMYGDARRLIRKIDPNHYVSFRMAEAGNPNYRWEGRIPYDFPFLAAGVDIIEPEAYGRIGDWEKVKPGWFEFEYAKWAAPEKPTMWAEMGVSTWDISRMIDSPQRMDFQAMFYRAFYRLLISTGANGVFFWWYPGGFRYGENSDYGIINPDGTDKPVTKVIRENAAKFLNGPARRSPDYWITIDRDAHPDGIAGIYDAAKDEFWNAVEQGKYPGLRTAGTGTDSSNCPDVAVGNVPWTGSNPAKYLDAVFDSVQVKNENGQWVNVEKGGSLKIVPGKPVVARVEFTNLGEAKLLAGGVNLTCYLGDKRTGTAKPLTSDVPHLGSAAVDDCTIVEHAPDAPTKITLTFSARSKDFGERFNFTLQP